MNHRTLLPLVMVLVTLLPGIAEAKIWTIYYNDAGRPNAAAYSKTNVIRAIQQALREYETAMYDSNVIARWGGETTSTHGGDGWIVVTWRPMPADICARTCRENIFHCNAGAIGPREIQLDNSLRIDDASTGNTRLNPVWVPPNTNGNGFRCQDLRASFLHELAHHFRDRGDESSNTSTVLSYSINDLANRHLWNTDAFDVISGAGPHSTNIRVQIQNSATQAILSTADFVPSSARPHTPVSITMGNGAGVATGTGTFVRNFVLAWGDRAGWPYSVIRVSQHDGINHFWDQTLPGNFGTMRRPCVAASGLDQIVVFTGSAQIPDAGPPNGAASASAGLRSIHQSESHDGGFTWSFPITLAGQTRNGTSCDVDPVTGRVVVAVQGGDDTIWTASRFPGSGNSWTNFTRLEAVGTFKIPQTSDMPDLVFDRFSPGGSGRIAWLEDATLTHRVGNVRFNGSSYQFDTSLTPFITERLDPSGVASHELLRTTPVLSFDGSLIFHFMTSSVGLMSAFSQTNFALSSTNFTRVDFSFPPAPISWYTGAAQNPSSFTTGTVQRMLLNPN